MAFDKARLETFFDGVMERFGFGKGGRKIAVAVSGGADSMALCRLLHWFARKNATPLVIFNVDHGLRPESADESRWVAREAARLNIPCHILKRTGEKPSSGIERTARNDRYGLLFAACRSAGAEALFLGHHKRDQAETFLIRKRANSGAFGLAGMSAVRSFAFGRMYRPLLGISPEDLRAYNKSIGQEWIEDPSNATDEFERGRLRKSVSAEVLEDAFRQSLIYGGRRIETERKRAGFLSSFAEISNAGFALFSRKDFVEADRETALGSLAELIRAIANKPYFPAADALNRLYGSVSSFGFSGATLGGCRISPASKDRVLIWREYSDLPAPSVVEGERLFYWDRFAFELSESVPEKLTVAPLEDRLKKLRPYPKRCFFCVPALFDREGLFLAPHLGYKKTMVSCRADFAPLFPVCLSPEWTLPVVF